MTAATAETVRPSRAAAYSLLPLLVAIWGANWAVMKIGLASIPPMWFATIRTAFGSACLFGLLAATGRLVRPRRRDLPILLSVGLLQMALFQPLVNFGLARVAAGRAAVLVYTTPLWVTPGAILLLGERVRPLKIFGLACGFAGIVALFNPLALDWSDRDVVVGSAELIGASLVWALTILHIRSHRWHSSPLVLTAWQLLLALGALLPATLALEGPLHARWTPALVAIVVYNGPIATAFAYWAATSISRALPAISSSLGLLGVPAVGILASLLLLGERPDLALLGGFGLVLAGVVLVIVSDVRA